MKFLLIFVVAVLFTAQAWANGRALAVNGNDPVMLILPDDASENISDITVVEIDRSGQALNRQPGVLMEVAVADPEIRIRRALRFTPKGNRKGTRYFYFSAQVSNGPVAYERENLLPTGDFEKKGWWIGNLNPGAIAYGSGRSGEYGLKVDCRRVNNGGPVNAGTEPKALMQLQDPANIPAVLRVYTKTVASPEGMVGGMTLRMRRFNSNGKYIDNYMVFSVQGAKPGFWVEQQFILNKPLPADTGKLDIYLVNMAPRDGVCFLIDDMAILPVKKMEPLINVKFPDSGLYAGETFTVSLSSEASDALRYVSSKTIFVINGKKITFPVQKIENSEPQINGGTLVVEVYQDDKLINTYTGNIADNNCSVSFTPDAGDYRIVATVKTTDGKSISQQVNYQVLEDPFAKE